MRSIYIYQNNVNNKIYVGQTNNLTQRKCSHKCCAFTQKKEVHLYRALRRYGLENFTITEWEKVEDNDIDDTEIFWIGFFRSWDRDFGYNHEFGGRKNKKMSEETKRKISFKQIEYHKTHVNGFYGKSHSDETKKLISIANSGRHHTEEAKQKMSIARSGEKNHMFGKHQTEKTKAKISAANKGKCYNTPEHMAKIHKETGERLKGIPRTQEVKDKISVSLIGFKHSEGAKQKMSESKRGENAPAHKLTWELVGNLREDYKNGMRGKKLYTKYNIGETAMYNIINNQTWKIKT